MRSESWFTRWDRRAARISGRPIASVLAFSVVLAWLLTGPVFHYSDTWQLVINTGTTIVTFLMVFLIQNTQNRDILTVQLKLSELVLAMKGAKDRFAAIEDLTDEELQELHDECKKRAAQTLTHIEQRRDIVEELETEATNAASNGTAKTGTGGNKARVAAARAKSQRKTAAAH